MDDSELGAVFDRIVSGTSPGKLESDRLEFKTAKPSLKDAFKDLTEAAICLANADGGWLVVGIRDSAAGPDAFAGTDVPALDLRDRIYALTVPPLLVDVSERTEQDVRVLVVRVPSSPTVHSTVDGRTLRRVGAECVPMGGEEIARVREERQGFDWSAQAGELSLEHVDDRALSEVRGLLARAGAKTGGRLARGDTAEMLVALGASIDGRTLTRAGEILLCDSTSLAAPDVVLYVHRLTPAGEPDAVVRFGPPVLTAFQQVMREVETRITSEPLTLRGGQQVRIEDVPILAVREAVANALVHGDYRFRREVVIDHSPGALAVTSAGRLVSGVTPETILRRGSRRRFDSIARLFRQLGLAEEMGEGVKRMYRELIRSGREAPRIEERADEVTVRFAGPATNASIARFMLELPSGTRDDVDTLLAVHHLCGKPTIQARVLAQLTQTSIDDAQRSLVRMSSGSVSLIEPTIGTARYRMPTYRLRHDAVAALGSALAYHRRDAAELEAKVVRHVREYGYINNGTVQHLLDVNVHRASAMLRDLVSRDVLAKVSEQSRGTAVRYGPGSAFPAKPRRGRS